MMSRTPATAAPAYIAAPIPLPTSSVFLPSPLPPPEIRKNSREVSEQSDQFKARQRILSL